jgi:hypothetical protein
MAVYVPRNARAEEDQQPKTGLLGSLCQLLLGNHHGILRGNCSRSYWRTHGGVGPQTTVFDAFASAKVAYAL